MGSKSEVVPVGKFGEIDEDGGCFTYTTDNILSHERSSDCPYCKGETVTKIIVSDTYLSGLTDCGTVYDWSEIRICKNGHAWRFDDGT